ncbi:hypothetical protein TURU_014220 [Turdus rufiventris]|nr:hypothetical protein TURU_014220 [Turdus rufiventris]
MAMSVCAVPAEHSRHAQGTGNTEVPAVGPGTPKTGPARTERGKLRSGASAGVEPQGNSSEESEASLLNSEGEEISDSEAGHHEKEGVSGNAAASDQAERRCGQGRGGRAPGVMQTDMGRAQGGDVLLGSAGLAASQFPWQQVGGQPQQKLQYQSQVKTRADNVSQKLQESWAGLPQIFQAAQQSQIPAPQPGPGTAQQDVPVPLRPVSSQMAEECSKVGTSQHVIVEERMERMLQVQSENFEKILTSFQEHGSSPGGQCCNCGGFGHFKRNCLELAETGRPPDVCPRCRKGNHLANREPKWVTVRHVKPYQTQAQADTNPGSKETSTQIKPEAKIMNSSSINT